MLVDINLFCLKVSIASKRARLDELLKKILGRISSVMMDFTQGGSLGAAIRTCIHHLIKIVLCASETSMLLIFEINRRTIRSNEKDSSC